MAKDKRERRRLKRAQKRKGRQRQDTQAAQAEARRFRADEAGSEAYGLMQAGHLEEAQELAARAVTLAPRARDPAILYVEVAERTQDLHHRIRAYEHYCEVVEPNVTVLIALAALCMEARDYDRAARTTQQARAHFPPKLRDRSTWLLRLESIEHDCKACLLARARGEAAEAKTGSLFAARQQPATSPAPPPPAVAKEEKPAAEPFVIPVAVAGTVDGLEALGRATWDSPDDVRLALLAARLRQAQSFDTLLSVEAARGLMRLSHQEETARKVLSVMLGRALLADEVGLGKTIEAGLVLSEYRLRGQVDRALILTPASLVGQWKEELAGKFAIESLTTEDADLRRNPERFWSQPGVLIASLPTARTPQNRALVAAQRWDMVIVDEAHALKNARTQSHALVAALAARFLLLLTATPIENDVEELYNLVSLIRPGQLGGRAEFVRRLGGRKRLRSEAGRQEVHGLLGEIMIRNTRALSGVRLPPRFARTILIEPAAAEMALYGHLVTALRALGAGGRTRLLLSVLLQEAGSSPHAVRATLERVRADADLDAAARRALAPAIDCLGAIPETGKGAKLLDIIAAGDGSVVVFTRFRATLDYLAEQLGAHGVRHERLDGGVPPATRLQAIERCREAKGVLLSTDVGSEGLNLQFCRRIVNFDLPWNPMRIEQRIGRVHRIGQDEAVEVINFCLAGSIEERILRILDERINLFEMVVGEVEMILGYLDDERDLADVMFDTFSIAEAERREGDFVRIGDALAAARARYENVKAFDESFFRNELGV